MNSFTNAAFIDMTCCIDGTTHSNLQLSVKEIYNSGWPFCDETVHIQDQFFSIKSIFLKPSSETVVADMD